MAIDFSNRNPDDKDGVYRIQPAQQRGWIEVNEDGSWKGRFQVARPASTTGWKEVGYATVTLNDGRQFRAVLDENNQPISEIGDPTGTDADVARSFSQRQGDAKPPGGMPTRTVNGQVFQWNPVTRAYDIPTGQTPSSGSSTKPPIPPGGSSSTEGTPLPGGGWDNTRPRKVIKDAQGNTIWSKELEGAELNAWRQQQAQTGEKREPVPNRPGWTSVTRTVTHAGNTKTETVYVDPDGKEVPSLPTDPADRVGKPTGNTRTVQNNGVTVKETEYLLPDGTKEWRTQTETTQPDRVGKPTGNTRQRTENGQTIKETEYILPDGTKEWRSQTTPTDGVGNIPGLPTYVPDLTKPGAGLFDYAKQLDEFMKANPSFTWEKRQQVLEAAQKQANTVVQEFNIGASILREQYQQNVTQRNQDMTQANNRATLANTHHQNAIALIEKFSPYLGVTPGDAGKLFLGMMASQLATATAYGGMQNYAREEMDPRLTAFADRSVGGASRPGSPTPPGTPPNALGLGSIGALQAPGRTPPPPAAPAAPANPDAAMAEAVRQQQAASGAPLPPPLMGPQPQAVSMDATDPAQQGQPALTPGAPSNTGQVGDPMTMPPAINPLTGEPTGLAPLPGQSGFADRDDDILTVEDTVTGQVVRISRGQYNEQRRQHPNTATRVVKVEPAAAAQSGDLLTREDVDSFTNAPSATPVSVPDPYATPSPAQSMVPPGLESMFANVLPPEPVSWHERAQAQASMFETPSAANVARGEALFGGAVPNTPMFGGFTFGGPAGRAPLPLASRVPGLTSEADAEARRQLAMEGVA